MRRNVFAGTPPQCGTESFDQPLRELKRIVSLPNPSEAEREAEVVLRLLPELRKLNRYEARAYARKDRALGEVSLRMSKCDSR